MSAHLKPAVNENDHIQGDNNAPIELVEYGDYQCPSCGYAYPIIKGVQEKLKNNLKFVFRNFPLTQMHPDAFNAALAVEAAALQGKFWEMHDMVFEHQKRLTTEHLLSYAKKVGLDIDRFTTDINKQELSDRVGNDIESGILSGVNGTPSLYINGQKYNGILEEEYLVNHLKSLLNKV
ncbi:MAG TPA: thioredoxin domain-containing protein [Bacteroidia bacterium]|jgi:protein-disulfide isomerase|nr:thioredoxin domain-containing protein [Bacteroidia bacterium]